MTDNARYARDLGALRTKLAAASPSAAPASVIDDDAVWAVYAGVEKLIAVLRFRLDYETPGVFTKLPDGSDPWRLVMDARELLTKAEAEMSDGRGLAAVRTLREARNDLRSYLTVKRKGETTVKRTSSAKGAVGRRRGSVPRS